MLLLLFCWIISGITADDPPMKHYRVKNSSLCLNIRKSQPNEPIMWLFNDTAIFINDKVRSNYTNKLNYYPSNFSLCINNVTETDSGIYKVTFLDSTYKLFAETHRLYVEEIVPTPAIRMSVVYSNLSAKFCYIQVNCSIQDSWMLSICDEDSCRTFESSFRTVNITVSTNNRSVVCSGNNHVSRSNVSENTEATCFKHEDTQEAPSIQIIVVIVCVCVCVVFVVLIISVAKRCFSTENNHHQAPTSTVQLGQSQPVEAQPQPVPRASTSSSSQAEVSYENVEAPHPNQTSSPAINPRQELCSSETVDTVYSFLQVPNGTTSADGKKDTEGHKSIGEASTSQLVTLDDAEQPMQIDTVYSVLQTPKNLKSQHHQ